MFQIIKGMCTSICCVISKKQRVYGCFTTFQVVNTYSPSDATVNVIFFQTIIALLSKAQLLLTTQASFHLTDNTPINFF